MACKLCSCPPNRCGRCENLQKWSGALLAKRSFVASLFGHSLGFILLTITVYQLKLAWCRRHGVSQLAVIFQLSHRFRAPHEIGFVGSGVEPLKGSSSFADQPSRNKLSSPLLQVQPATVELLNSFPSQTASLPATVADVRTYKVKWSIFMAKRSLVASLFGHSLGFILLIITAYQQKLAWCHRHGVNQLVEISSIICYSTYLIIKIDQENNL